jgi:hypothetical protein
MQDDDPNNGNRSDAIRASLLFGMRREGICGFSDGVKVEAIPGDFVYISRRGAKVLFKPGIGTSDILVKLELHGLVERCVLGCGQYCARAS